MRSSETVTLGKKASRPNEKRAAARAKRENGPDLRSWIALLKRHGQLRRITAEVDWDQELAGITRVNLGLGGPGLL